MATQTTAERRRDIDRYKNTATGALFISEYTPASTSAFTSAAAAQIHSPSVAGATGARFALIQVHDVGADVSVEVGISSNVAPIQTVAAPSIGSLKVGRTYGMPYIQLPVDDDAVVVVTWDLSVAAAASYSVIFVD